MKILVFAHRFEVGGSQRNAIDLAVYLRDHYGHDLTIFATPGPMVAVARASGLRFVEAPTPSGQPSWSMMNALRATVRQERPDIIHVWDWWQCLDAYLSAHILDGVPLVVSDMLSERVTRVLPRLPLTTFGTPEFVDIARTMGRRRVCLLAPPVNVSENSPYAVSSVEFRDQYKLTQSEIIIVTVSRLTNNLKGESLRRTIAAVRQLGVTIPLRFVLVGSGDAEVELQALATETNTALGREAVTLTGELLDPRAAYNTADIVVGMGGSALRGMAFSKPVIVVGANGFARTLTPDTAPDFLYKGLYGDSSESEDALSDCIKQLAVSKQRAESIGEFSRSFVVENFSVEKVGRDLDTYIQEANKIHIRRVGAVFDAIRTLIILKLSGGVPQFIKRLVKGRENGRLRSNSRLVGADGQAAGGAM